MKQRFIEYLKIIESKELFETTLFSQNIIGSMEKLFETTSPCDYVTNAFNWSADSHYYWRSVDVVWKKIVSKYE